MEPSLPYADSSPDATRHVDKLPALFSFEEWLDLAEAFSLTARQQQVIDLMSRGHSTESIASVLQLSPETVRMHIRRTLHVLGACDRLEAILILIHQNRKDRCDRDCGIYPN